MILAEVVNGIVTAVFCYYDIMNDQIFTNTEIINRIEPVLHSYGVNKAVLFGSYGKGVATADSDVDLLVDSGLKGLKFVGLVESIREALDDKEVDVLDIAHIEPDSRVDSEIKKTGVVIYAR